VSLGDRLYSIDDTLAEGQAPEILRTLIQVRGGEQVIFEKIGPCPESRTANPSVATYKQKSAALKVRIQPTGLRGSSGNLETGVARAAKPEPSTAVVRALLLCDDDDDDEMTRKYHDLESGSQGQPGTMVTVGFIKGSTGEVYYTKLMRQH
jgi:hypothetical protein